MSDCQEYYLIFAIKKSKLKPDTQRAHWLHSLTRDQESLKEARLTPPGGLGQYNVPHTVLGGSHMPAPTYPTFPLGPDSTLTTSSKLVIEKSASEGNQKYYFPKNTCHHNHGSIKKIDFEELHLIL